MSHLKLCFHYCKRFPEMFGEDQLKWFLFYRLEHNQTQEQALKKAIKNIFEGSTAELQENISLYKLLNKYLIRILVS